MDADDAQERYGDALVEHLRAIGDPVSRIHASKRAIENNHAVNARVGAVIRDTVREMSREHRPVEIARILGLTRARVSQLLKD